MPYELWACELLVIEQSNLYGYDIGGLFFKIINLVFLALAFVAADVKSALHKKRKDGKKAPLQRLTTMQRVYVSRLILKHGDNHEVRGLFCYGYSLECQFTSGIYASDIEGIFTSCAGHVKGHKVESHATSTWDT